MRVGEYGILDHHSQVNFIWQRYMFCPGRICNLALSAEILIMMQVSYRCTFLQQRYLKINMARLDRNV